MRFDAEVARLWCLQSPSDIASDLGCSVATVYNAAHRAGCSVTHRSPGHRWTAAEDALLTECFSTAKPRDLEARFGLTFEQIRTRAKRLGLRSRQALALSSIKHDFFGTDSPTVAYFAGLIAADGWIPSDRPEVNLALKTSDRAMVDRFALETASSRAVGIYADQARATVRSVTMVDDLATRWGVTQQKTKTLMPPVVADDDLQLAYVAGHMDGDGFISPRAMTNGGVGLRCGAIGTEAVIRWAAEVLDRRLRSIGRDRPVRVRRIREDTYSFPIFEWRTSERNSTGVLGEMKRVIGDLGIVRKWHAYERYAAIVAKNEREAA